MSGELAYFGSVGVGILLAAAATWALPERSDPVPPPLRMRLRVAALLGGIAGAYLFELPADLFGWSGPASHGVTAIGGRTVLGGLLGGWGAVELVKHRARFVGATGDRFALPLALGLAAGRMGCTLRGCCEGVALAASDPLGRVDLLLHGVSRFPAALVESWFHAGASLVLVLAARLGVARGLRLSIYLTVYAVVRFALETVRDQPRVLLSLTYYQWLALALFTLTATTWWRRAREG